MSVNADFVNPDSSPNLAFPLWIPFGLPVIRNNRKAQALPHFRLTG
jgi:hypothetical protein